jgi:hypothetical protein
MYLNEIFTENYFELLSLNEATNNEFDGKNPVFVLLTDTKTHFSKISRVITGDPYNHVSIAFDKELSKIYTYALKTDLNGSKGGFKEETLDIFPEGARYTMYVIYVNDKTLKKLKDTVKYYKNNASDTSYFHGALINSILNKEIFTTDDENKMICSQFIYMIFEKAGIKLLNNRIASTIQPYQLIKSKLLTFYKRGHIHNHHL